MKDNINILELLKDCPRGMKLDCSMFENTYFDKIDDDEDCLYRIICYVIDDGVKTTIRFTKFGGFNTMAGAKCVIFPKGKTTWEGFHRPFKDGDILATDLGSVFYLNTRLIDDERYGCYVGIGGDGSFLHICESFAYKECCGFATEEEKEKLFKAIKDNGYKWNPETKTLEKLPKFKDGDIISNPLGTCIFKGEGRIKGTVDFYCGISDIYFNIKDDKLKPDSHYGDIVDYRLATEEEKEKLFKAIKDNGYKWNPETKTLEKSIVPKFKVGDIIQDIDTYKVKITEVNIEDECYGYESMIAKGIGSITFSEQDNWKLAQNKLVKPRFKVGDRIIKKNGVRVPILITNISDEFYYSNTGSSVGVLSISEQDEYTLLPLLPNKFDINTLKPFDKVLVRDCNSHVWNIQFFEKYKSGKFPFICMGYNKYKECIPYEGNEHLLDTADNCDEYFKNWE